MPSLLLTPVDLMMMKGEVIEFFHFIPMGGSFLVSEIRDTWARCPSCVSHPFTGSHGVSAGDAAPLWPTQNTIKEGN